jgi:hypothetical protein
VTTVLDAWPPLPYEAWEPTKQTLHRYTQIVGKVRMALVPPRNHWWHVTLYVTARGLTTGPMPAGDRDVEIAFDLVDHRLDVLTSHGGRSGFSLVERPACADFYALLFGALAELGIEVDIHPQPFDLGESPPFAEDRANATYDPDAVTRYWQALAATPARARRVRGRLRRQGEPRAPVLALVRPRARPLQRPARGARRRRPRDRRGLLARGHRVRLLARRRPHHAVSRLLLLHRARARRLRDQPLDGAAAEWHDYGQRDRWRSCPTTPCARAPTHTPSSSRSSPAPTAPGRRRRGWDITDLAR